MSVSCPWCGVSVDGKARRCPYCAAEIDPAEPAASSSAGAAHDAVSVETKPVSATAHYCPRCTLALLPVRAADTEVEGCGKCNGLWIDRVRLDDLCAHRERQTALLWSLPPVGEAGPPTPDSGLQIPCPRCRTWLHRRRFAPNLSVVVDVCAEHGVWFDRDELRRVVEFLLQQAVLGAAPPVPTHRPLPIGRHLPSQSLAHEAPAPGSLLTGKWASAIEGLLATLFNDS